MSTATSTIPAPIRSHVGEYVALRKRRRLWRAIGAAVAFTLGWVLVCCLVDRVAALPSALRTGLLVINALVVAILLARPVLGMLSRRVDWIAAVDEIEQRDDRFRQRLQTVTSQHLDPPAYRGSHEIVEHLTREVADLLRSAAPARLVPFGPVVRPWLLAGVLLLTIMGLMLIPLLDMPRLLTRYAAPWLNVAPATTTRLIVAPGDVDVLEGEPLTVLISADRLGSGPVVVHYRKQGAPARMIVPRDEPTGGYRADLGPIERDTPYYVTGGDATSPTYTARVLRRPVVREFRIRYAYPSSARREPLTVSNTDGLIEAPVGTEATVSVVATEPLSSAQLVLDGRTIRLEPTDDPHVRTASLMVEADRAYTLEMRSDRDILGTHADGVIRAIPDAPPLVRLLRPASAADLRLHPRDILALPYQALDDYGIDRLALRVEVLTSGAGGVARNLAQGRPATQPSVYEGADASRAVDGNTDGNYPAGSVTHTQHAANNYWQVDLGQISPVSVVEVWNRTDGVSERLSDFVVLVSNEPMPLDADLESLRGRADVTAFDVKERAGSPTSIDVYRDARFVRVHLPRPEFLSLAEVRVFEARDAAEPAPDSIAARWSAGPVDMPLPIHGDRRSQAGDARLDLATLNVTVGDVINVSVAATDTAGQTTVSDPSRILVTPRSIDLSTYERIAELTAAREVSDALVAELEGATQTFDQAKPENQRQRDAYLSALSKMNRHLSSATEASGRLLPALLRTIARSDSPDMSVALTDLADQAQTAAVVTQDVHSQFGFGEAPGDHAKGELHHALEQARRTRDDLETITEGERAAAVLADVENLAASDRAGPYASREAADRARQRAQRLRDDIDEAVKGLGLDPRAPDVAAQLEQKVSAAEQLMQSRRMANFEQPAREFGRDLRRDADRQLPLDERLHTAAQAEAVRPDGDLVRARDLMLASGAVAQLQVSARRDARDGGDDAERDAARQRASDELPRAMAALHRQHELNRRAPSEVPERERERVAREADAARQQLAQWAGDREALARDGGDAAQARLDEEQAMEANAALAQREYEYAGQIEDAMASPQASAATGQPMEQGARQRSGAGTATDELSPRLAQLQRDLDHAAESARELDDLLARQNELRADTEQASEAAERRTRRPNEQRAGPDPAAGELAARQEALADEIGQAAGAPRFADVANDDPESRLRAANAIASAQERLAAMPQILNLTRRAASLAWDMQAMADDARTAAEQAVPRERGIAERVAAAAGAQALEAEGRLRGVREPVSPQAAASVALSLAPYSPETAPAVESIGSELSPALARMQRAIDARDEPATDRAIADARRAIERVQDDLNGAQEQLMERDPLVAARAFASAAARSLSQPATDYGGAVANQTSAGVALQRASDQAIRQAAAARLAQLPGLGTIFAPIPGTGTGEAGSTATAANPLVAPLLADWGHLQTRRPDELTIAPSDTDPPGYQDALKAYFEALGRVQQQPGEAGAAQ